MDMEGENLYVAVWNDNPSYTGDRRPLWYMQYRGTNVVPGSECRINPIDGDPSWGSFLNYNVIHFAINGEYLYSISKKTGEDRYYLDVVRVGEHLSGSAMAKRRTSNEGTNKPALTCDIHPNPFNTATKIVFSLNRAADVDVEVINLKGEKVEQLVESRYEEGCYEIKWSAKSLPTGLYFVVLRADNTTDIKKVILLK